MPRVRFRVTVVAICSAYMVGGPSFTVGSHAVEHVRPPSIMPPIDCYSVGLALTEQNSGTLARVSQSQQGTKSFCVIVLLEAGKEGTRPRRVEFLVPNVVSEKGE